MKKRLLLAAAVVMSSLSSFAYEANEFVYTTKACYQVTDATNYYTGGVDLTNWAPITATEKALGDIFAIDTDETGVTYFKSLAADQNEGMSYTVSLPAGYYVMSVKICGPAAAAQTPLLSTHCSDAYVYTKHPDWLNYINVVQDDTIATSVDEETIESTWQTLAFGFESNGASEYKIVLKGINANVKIADIAIQPALPAADLRKKDFAMKYGLATLGLLGLDETTLPEDVEELYTTFKAMGQDTPLEEFDAYYDEFVNAFAEFRAANLDDQLTDERSHFGLADAKVSKLNEWGSWTGYPGGRIHTDAVGAPVHMGHYQGSAAWAWNPGDFCGIDQTVELGAGKYIFKTELQGFYRRENGGSWEADNSIKATEGYMFAVNAAGDTLATTGWYDVSGAVYTPNFIVFELADKTTVTLGAKVYDYKLYQGTIRGGALNVMNVEFWGKTTAKYSKAQYDYENDVLGQITAGRDALTTAQSYVDSVELKWGKEELSQAIAAVEPVIGAYEALDEDAIIATYDPDTYLAGKGLEVMDDDSTYYVRLLASEVYRTGTKIILDANKAFLAKNDTLKSLADAIAKAEAELDNRVYEFSTERAQLENEIVTAKGLLEKMQASEYTPDNAASIVAENEALAAAIATYQVIPAEKLTTVVDIDFNQFEMDGSNVPEGPDATIEGAKGSMVFTNFSNVSSGQPFEVGVDANGAKDSVNVLRVGNGTATVDFAANMAGTTNILRVSMDWWFGQLTGKYCGFYLKDADDNNVSGINLSVYDGKCDYDPCNMAGKFNGTAGFTVSARTGNAGHCVDANKTNMVLYMDYGTKQMQMVTTTPNGVYASDWAAFDGQELAKFVLSGNYNNSDRRSWFDNLKIEVIQAGVPTGIQTVNTVKANNGVMYNIAGQAVSNNFKGIVVKNGKKFVK